MSMLKVIDTNLWVAEQPLKYFGLEVGTRMTVIRLPEGKLAIISPIQLEENIIQHLNRLGKVSYIIAPNLYHHLFLTQFKQYYPDAELWAPSSLKDKRPDLVINRVLNNQTIQLLDGIQAKPVDGFNTLDLKGPTSLNEWVFLQSKSRTLIMTDLAFHFDQNSALSVKVIAQFFGGYQQLRPSILEKLATTDKERVKRSIQDILEWEFDRVIVAHGSIIERDGKQKLKQGYEWFLDQSLS